MSSWAGWCAISSAVLLTGLAACGSDESGTGGSSGASGAGAAAGNAGSGGSAGSGGTAGAGAGGGTGGSAGAANVVAASCARSDVQAAIDAAAVGDIVDVPPGDCDWSGLVVAKALRLRGAGKGKTRITLTGDNSITKQQAGVVRISGFSFSKSGGGNESKGWTVTGAWKNAEPVVIENNEFTISGSGLFLIAAVGGVVIAANDFTGDWDDSFLQLKDTVDAEGSWSSADSLGARDTDGKLNHYVEDNTFYGGTNQGIDADDATRVVYRHNALTYSSFNTHGWASSPAGVRHFEVYANQFKHLGGSEAIANQNWAIWIRGGSGVIFDNTLDDLAGSHWGQKDEIRLTIRGAEDDRPQGTCANTKYPVPHQIGQSHDGSKVTTDPLYLWGNQGAQAINAGWNWGNPCGFVFDDFFQWGRDAVKDGTPKPGYTPYAYPHPLRG
ncbi:MAG: hypothetical protein R3B13_17585 [Polyangiaceae bacterium]